MAEEPTNTNDFLAGAFRNALNQHGDVFQHRVRTQAAKLSHTGSSRWIVGPPEFPVAVRDRDARIDFILEHESRAGCDSVYLVAECKRANPSLKYWCFAKAPTVTDRDHHARWFIAEHLTPTRGIVTGSHIWTASGCLVRPLDQLYHLGMEIKAGGGQGDKQGNPRGAIEDAATQAYRGANGFVDYLKKTLSAQESPHGAVVIPVIFTTASIFTSDADLSGAELSTGNLTANNVPLQQRDWIYYQYPGSVGLKHSLERNGSSQRLDDVLIDEYLRTIPIVSASGIDNFLTNFPAISSGIENCP